MISFNNYKKEEKKTASIFHVTQNGVINTMFLHTYASWCCLNGQQEFVTAALRVAVCILYLAATLSTSGTQSVLSSNTLSHYSTSIITIIYHKFYVAVILSCTCNLALSTQLGNIFSCSLSLLLNASIVKTNPNIFISPCVSFLPSKPVAWSNQWLC